MSRSSRSLVSRIAGIRSALPGVGATGLAVATALFMSSGVSAADPVRVQVGMGEGAVIGEAFLPGAITVEAGQSVIFTVGSDEPQMLTFAKGPTDAAPGQWPVTGWAAPVDPLAGPVDVGGAVFDGTSFLNTGLLSKGSTATVTFATPGSYTFQSDIHPGMVGTVVVVEQGAGGLTTQEQADTAAAATSDALLALVEPTRQSRLDDLDSTKASDGTRIWDVYADASTVATDLPGGGTGYLDLFEMLPAEAGIGVGDTVHWSATARHDITFPATGQDPTTLDPSGPAVGGDIYDGTSEYRSGLLNAGPGAPTSYTLTFPAAGVFQYVDTLHPVQTGTIAVGQPLPSSGAEAPASAAPAASTAPALSPMPAATAGN